MPKLSASEVLISPNPLPCQGEGCGRQPSFAIMVPYTTRRLCPAHLYPHLRRRSLDALLLSLGNVVYEASLRYVTLLLEEEQRTWQEIPEAERQGLPLGDPLRSLIECCPEEHYELVPLCALTKTLARMNAQAVVAAMDGENFIQRKRAAQEQKRQRGGGRTTPEGVRAPRLDAGEGRTRTKRRTH